MPRAQTMSPAFFIYEFGANTRDWYDTLAFRCGSPNCMKYEMDDWLERTHYADLEPSDDDAHARAAAAKR